MEERSQQLFTKYKTISKRAEGLYTEKRSKFISIAIPVENEEEALQEVQAIRKQYYDARHVCWAYRIGRGEAVERYNDDGEPSSTAGKPILGQILSNELTDILIVVIRYFGGVKLGTGGLIVAYRTAAEDALSNSMMVVHTLYSKYQLTFPFDLINSVMMLLRQFQAETLDTDASTEGHIWQIQVPNEIAQSFEVDATNLYQLNIKLLNELID